MIASVTAVHKEMHADAQTENEDQWQITPDMRGVFLQQQETDNRQETQQYNS
jgi:hypothetical protein